MNATTASPSLLILGADTVLAAHPATPVQLAHACLADGFDHVIPGAWGDELVAAHVLERVRSGDLPAVQCSCPLVVHRLSAYGDTIEPMLIRSVAPPLALARHLRAAFAPGSVFLTYVGACPAGGDAVFDAWLTPAELFTRLDRRGLDVAAQPTAFDSMLSPDRRRFWSEPGGVPYLSLLAQTGVEVRTLRTDDVVPDLADLLLSRRPLLIDIALSAQCACSGAAGRHLDEASRTRITDLEPPRALSPVVDAPTVASLQLDATQPSPDSAPAGGAPLADRGGGRVESPPNGAPVLVAAVAPPPRRTPVGESRALLGAMPLTRRDRGRQLPRAYIARRRSSPRGLIATRSAETVDRDQLAMRRRRLTIAAVGVLGLIAGLVLAWIARLYA